MTGLELLQRVRQEFPDTIRIMLTGHADTETVIDAVNNSEIYRFLTKPWNDDELKLVLRLAASHLDSMRRRTAGSPSWCAGRPRCSRASRDGIRDHQGRPFGGRRRW